MYTRWTHSSLVLPSTQTFGPSLIQSRKPATRQYVLDQTHQYHERIRPACECWNRSGRGPGTICRASHVMLLGDAASASSTSAAVIMSQLTARHPGILIGFLMNTIVYILGNKVLLKGLALDGYVSSWVLGFLTFSAFGLYGYSLVCLYFLLGSWVTKLKMDVKIREGTAEAMGGRRGIGSVLGSGVAGMVCAGIALTQSDIPMSLLQTGFVASFCSKLSDTVSSEIGKAYGKTTYLATTFERVPRGTEGAVSLEGTLAGILASFFLGFCAVLTGMITVKGLVFVISASFIANYGESVLGAVYQDSVPWLTNDIVNIIQIMCASIVSILLSYYFM
jgi:uncharacterized protein (TIGR00297 family)